MVEKKEVLHTLSRMSKVFHIDYFGSLIVIKEFKSVSYLQGGLLEDVQACHLPVLSSIVTVHRFQTGLAQISTIDILFLFQT